MKFIGLLVGTLIALNQAHADVIRCSDKVGQVFRQLRVYAEDGGYRFTAEERVVFSPKYQKHGEVRRHFINGEPLMLFTAPFIGILEQADTYEFEDNEIGEYIKFSKTNCTLNPNEGL